MKTQGPTTKKKIAYIINRNNDYDNDMVKIWFEKKNHHDDDDDDKLQ